MGLILWRELASMSPLGQAVEGVRRGLRFRLPWMLGQANVASIALFVAYQQGRDEPWFFPWVAPPAWRVPWSDYQLAMKTYR